MRNCVRGWKSRPSFSTDLVISSHLQQGRVSSAGTSDSTHLMSRSRMLSTLLAATLAIFLNLILCSYIRLVVDNV